MQQDEMPEAFFANFGDGPVETAQIPTIAVIRESLESAGALDDLVSIQKEWDWYGASYERIERGLLK
jgi:hypothetical protein